MIVETSLGKRSSIDSSKCESLCKEISFHFSQSSYYLTYRLLFQCSGIPDYQIAQSWLSLLRPEAATTDSGPSHSVTDFSGVPTCPRSRPRRSL